MAKSAQSTKFRGVDIDELDENKFQDEGEEDSGQSGPDEAEVNNLLLQYPCTDDGRLSLFISFWNPLSSKQLEKRNIVALLFSRLELHLVSFCINLWSKLYGAFSASLVLQLLSIEGFKFNLDSEGRGLFYAIWP